MHCLKTYKTKRLWFKKFEQYRKNRQFYDTVTKRCFREKDSVIIMGNGNIQSQFNVLYSHKNQGHPLR